MEYEERGDLYFKLSAQAEACKLRNSHLQTYDSHRHDIMLSTLRNSKHNVLIVLNKLYTGMPIKIIYSNTFSSPTRKYNNYNYYVRPEATKELEGGY